MSFWNVIGVSISADEKKRAERMAEHFHSSMRVSDQGGLSKSVESAKKGLQNSASSQNSPKTKER